MVYLVEIMIVKGDRPKLEADAQCHVEKKMPRPTPATCIPVMVCISQYIRVSFACSWFQMVLDAVLRMMKTGAKRNVSRHNT